jgi:hypothetical protein
LGVVCDFSSSGGGGGRCGGERFARGKREDSLGEGDREEAVNRDCWEKESDFWEKDRSIGEREKWVSGKKK